jgi:hypothetical protein
VYIQTVTGRLTKLLADQREERLADDAQIKTWLRLADLCLLPTNPDKIQTGQQLKIPAA